MKLIAGLLLSLTLSLPLPPPAAGPAATRVIVRVTGGQPVVQGLCMVLGCAVNYGLGDPDGQVFLITMSSLSPSTILTTLSLQPGVVSVELDVAGSILKSDDGAQSAPPALYDTTPVSYYGTTVRNGYANQPASQIVRLADAQNSFHVAGSGIVAVIDTGVDPNQPVLSPILLPGYDFTRNKDGADETGDVQQSTADVVDGGGPIYLDSSTANINQSTADVVDTTSYTAFGHGTMVAGIVHLVAPRAWILPLKAFSADGTGYTSDAIRAIYYAVHANARVLNMSFSFATPSREFLNALRYADRNNVIAVASAGNNGQDVAVYPAGYAADVMGVASTTYLDTRSSFSNYGVPQVWVAAPGEWIVSTYPWGIYAASSGTSFSAPFVAGAAALLLDVNASVNESAAAQAIAHAKSISPDMGNGRLDLYQAVAAWRQALGMP